VWFLIRDVEKRKTMLKKESFKAGKMWRFKKISYLYTSRRLYEQIIFSTWRPSVLCNTHNLVWKTRRWRFNVPLQCTLTDPFCFFHMRSRWYDYFFFYYYIYFFNCCFIWICLSNNIFLLHAIIIGREPRPTKFL
jgi:hypothetical protein